ncbi:MAG TPA: hypothetical protein VGB44_09525 [Flavobacterium sp.]|jgi:hypothetical protein
MEYSITSLTNVADCEVLLSMAAREKADLDFKKLSDERLTVRYAETSQEVNADLQGVITEIAAQETIISVLPEGQAKDEAINKKIRLEYKKFLLETRKASFGTVALLEKEMDLGRVNREIGEVDAFIDAVKAQKELLQQSA